MKTMLLLSIMALSAHANDLEAIQADAYYQDRAYQIEREYDACYEHLAGIDPALADALEACMTDLECQQATTLCEGFNND